MLRYSNGTDNKGYVLKNYVKTRTETNLRTKTGLCGPMQPL